MVNRPDNRSGDHEQGHSRNDEDADEYVQEITQLECAGKPEPATLMDIHDKEKETMRIVSIMIKMGERPRIA